MDYIFFGLGNPGPEYISSRHNVGFLAIDEIVKTWDIPISRLQKKAMTGKGKFGEYRVLLAKPQTFMNLSGSSVNALVKFYRVPLNRIMIIFDDLDLPFGEIRIRQAGGSSGHKGMRSIIEQFGSNEFPRMRIGLGRPPGKRDPADYVLDQFSTNEQKELPFILHASRKAAETFITIGIDETMTKFNHNLLENES